MPCIFCLAVFAVFAGAISTAVLDQMEARIASVATEPVRRVVDSESATSFETAVALPNAPGKAIPVTVTVYKKHRRVRIQVRTHAVSREEAEAVENLLAHVLELTIVDRSDAHDEAKVREAFEEGLTEELTEAEASRAQPGRAGRPARQQRPQG
ncbi:MAG: hypothetical protein IPJ14_11460 [Kineosporiaceae bacterium]|nr:hypothetical protein [Kineosporiaceae bacterium]MBK7623244.1 hypothetical protein [Kineosporiaceae bacterium]MBK8074804.1 hypothetical protein [Kineosporiaceae bacterium]